jgi:radical SAM/Cys-rich protein
MALKTLQRAGHELASTARQREILADTSLFPAGTFDQTLTANNLSKLRTGPLQIFQVNLGKMCNQTCAHCHVDAGPERREIMTRSTAARILEFFLGANIQTLDLTGGAPELNPNFRWLVEQSTAGGRQVIDRCNLTILTAAGFTDLPEFLAAHRVQVIASLPCYLEENCDAQRGNGAFANSITAIRMLNRLGYGQTGTGLELDLVYNPVGFHLPPPQEQLESDYRRELMSRYGIRFSRLLTITNMPISRYLEQLLSAGKYSEYMSKLINAFNPEATAGLMCRNTLSVDWQGYIYDCDFNQMLDIPAFGRRTHIDQIDIARLLDREIQTANHCFGCTAGSGSSCQGSIVR